MEIPNTSQREMRTRPAYITKLESAGGLRSSFSNEDHALLRSLGNDVRSYGARRDIVHDGDRPDHVNLMIDGWACRYKVLSDGSRQITAFLLPGDLCDAHITMFDRMDHGIGALTDCRVAFIPRGRMSDLAERPNIARALWWASLVDEAVLRAWIVNLGRRDAFERVGHLICEVHARLRNIGLAANDTFELPLTQEDLADALGLTPVHINRTLRRLREEGLMTMRQRRIVIVDVAELQRAVGFEPGYLHLPRADASVTENQTTSDEAGR